MIDLTKAWPLGLGGKRWWMAAGGAAALLAIALGVDHPVSLWAQGWPEMIVKALGEITPYGESDWILYPSGVLFAATALVALVVRKRLLRLALWQFVGIFGFVFAGVGLPSLISTLAKRAIGRGRPEHFDATGLWSMQPNWLDWTYQSFPSGHATTAFALALVVGFLAPRWQGPAFAFAAAIAVSRVALGVHYPSDVLGGAILGVLGAYYVRWLFARRGWVFVPAGKDRIRVRPLSALKRLLVLRRRGSARGPLPGRT